jgi:glucose-6-phosphate-specific signal transduction histidine kinase
MVTISVLFTGVIFESFSVTVLIILFFCHWQNRVWSIITTKLASNPIQIQSSTVLWAYFHWLITMRSKSHLDIVIWK